MDNTYLLDFVETDPHGLNLKLFPLQRIILKATFGIPMDYKQEDFILWDKLREKALVRVNDCSYFYSLAPHEDRDEAGRMRIVHQRGNFLDWRDLPATGFNEISVFLGRRTGKTTLLSILAMVKLRQLLQHANPQEFYRIVRGSPIDFSFFTMDEEGGQRLLSMVVDHLNYSSWFTPYVREVCRDHIRLCSETERTVRYSTPSIQMSSKTSSVNHSRGQSCYFLAFDEFAHMKNTQDLYYAATPSTLLYHHKEDDEDIMDALTVSLSSPWFPSGLMYEQYERMDSRKKVFILNEITANANQNIPSRLLREQWERNPEQFDVEFGGGFAKSR